MAGWAPNYPKMNSRGLKENEMLMGTLLSQKSGIDLMQNCDLPPPSKVFSGSENMVISSMHRVFCMIGRKVDTDDFDAYGGGENEKLELLKALRLSQTRAREAERKVSSLVKERDRLANALLQESLQLFTYKQWVRLLEVQVLRSKAERQQEEGQEKLVRAGKDCEEGSSGESWVVALAFCWGIVGLGLAFGCCYLF